MHEFSLTSKPIAILLENKRQSLPQVGISEADIVIEMLVEYDISVSCDISGSIQT
jgi:hypothetical protein